MTSSTWAERYYILGWIDSVEPLAIGQRGYNTRIKWHVDYYLTGEYWRFEALRQQEPSRLLYSPGAGRIKRGPDSLKRPEPSNPRKWAYNGKTELLGPSFKDPAATETLYGPFVIFLYTHSDGATPPTTTFRVGFFPAEHMSGAYHRGGNTYYFPDLPAAYAGHFEEALGIPSSSIIGVWVSPMIGNTGGSFNFESGNTRCHYWVDAGYMSQGPHQIILPDTFKTDDMNKYLIEDPLGTVYATMPWELEFKYIYMTIDVGTNGAWLILFFSNSSSTNYSTWEAGEGREVKIPLPSVPVNDNAYGEYVLTGQRDYDMNMARIQQEQNLASGIAGAGQSAVGGAVAGGMTGAGGGIGAVAGLGIAIAGSVANYFINGYFNDKSQEQVDKLTSNQVSNVIINSGGISWFYQDRRWNLLKLSRDAVSAAELTAEQDELGYVTDTFAADCSTIISQGGGLRIEGLEVKGGISREGREYIAALFARGVHIDILT